MTDLKLICKHSQLLSGGKNVDLDTVVDLNENLNFFQSIDKTILFATLEELNKKDYLKNMSESEGFNYISNYEKEFEGITDKNYILNKLFSDKHEELNTIGYYNYDGNNLESWEWDNIYERMSIKYIISALKTVFIRRYIRKRNNIDYIRFFIIDQRKIYIYPPEAYNQTNIYFFQHSYPTANCNFSVDNETSQFPQCIYDYMNKVLINDTNANNLIIIKEKINLQKNFAALCLKIPLRRWNNPEPFLCSELEFSSIFNTASFDIPLKFDFGMFTFSNEKIVPLVFGRNELYDEIINLYNDSSNTRYRIETIKNSQTFSLFHFLYYNLTKTLLNHTELTLNYEEIDA